jgi:hypothetical protein
MQHIFELGLGDNLYILDGFSRPEPQPLGSNARLCAALAIGHRGVFVLF